MKMTEVIDGTCQPNDDTLEMFRLIWLDAEVDNVTNRDTQVKLRCFINYLKKFKNTNECQQYIEQKCKDDRLILIASGRLGQELIPHIHQLRQVSLVYVYCMNRKVNEEWAFKFPKIKAVIIDSDELISTIETDQKLLMKIEQPLSIHVFNRNINDDMIKIKTNNQFIYFQLIIDCLLRMKFSDNDKNELITLLKKEYQDNDNQLNIIREFETNYSSEKVLWWYTRHSFFDKIINKALQMNNIYIMFLYHSFISHLYIQLKQCQSTCQLKVYRSQILSNDELDNLKKNLGQLISINSFLSANIDRSKVLRNFINLKNSTNLQRVLFEIDADPTLINIKPFGLINSQSEFVDRSEVLFMVASIFSLNEIINDDNDSQLWIIKMSLCNDEIYHSLLNSINIKYENDIKQSNLRTLAKILWKMDKLDLAENYYLRLVNELSPSDPLLMTIYDDLSKMASYKEQYEISVHWFRKLIEVKKQNSLINVVNMDELNRFIDYFPNIERITPRPVCSKHGFCDQLNDEAHMHVYFHRLPCQYGGQCERIDEEEHSKTYEHPDFCSDKGFCKDRNESHLLKYRHVPLCKDGISCPLLIKNDSYHCISYRHWQNTCKFGSYCINFHNNEHTEDENHPFNRPCPYTPYTCIFYDKSQQNVDQLKYSFSSNIDIHCFRYSHVCPYGRQCPNILDKEHIQSNIHIIRLQCPHQDNCQLLNNENHLNSYSHPNIRDIRSLCHYIRTECRDRFNPQHIKRFRHNGHPDYVGVARYLALNKNINFVQNQNEMIETIENYVKESNWNPAKIIISDELKYWIRALQPIHRCNTVIFESILVHGHVMSRDHMNSLKQSTSVAKAIKQHMKVKYIFQKIKNSIIQKTCEEYIQMLVEIQFKKAEQLISNAEMKDLLIDVTSTGSESSEDRLIKSELRQKEQILSKYVINEDIETVRKWTNEIAQACFQLHSSPTGIGFAPDQIFGTNKHVFGILGPHTGYYYGDIIIVFQHELMLHPDSNFAIQAATTFGQSKNAYRWRPWLKDPGTPETRIQHFHRTKLHCSISGYEIAAAHELLALAGLSAKSTTNIDVNNIQKKWTFIDSHCVFEAHLPQLIPLDYIDRIYMAQTTFDSLSISAQQSAKTIFGNVLHITPHQIDVSIKPAGLHQPLDSTRVPYHKFVIEDIWKMIENRSKSLPSLEGTTITLSPSHFKNHIIIPITISQSYNQYKSNEDLSKDISNIIYIYWEAFNGDMMLILTKQMIDINIEQNDLQCLTCYIGDWPLNNMIKNTTQVTPNYQEGHSYISNHLPFMHEIIVKDHDFKSSSNSFHRGCNTDDYIIYNLTINRNTNEVILSIVGSNKIYNNQKISYIFNKTELDLDTLEYIQISAGEHTIPVRNLIIRYEPIEQFHPSIDIDYIKNNTIFSSSLFSNDKSVLKQNEEIEYTTSFQSTYSSLNSFTQQSASRKVYIPCPQSVNCLLQYVNTDEGRDHNNQYVHPCRFSELCHRKSVEPHLVHIPHVVPTCQDDERCQRRTDPFHRAQFRHSKLPDYLVPCKYQKECRTTTQEHKMKYSHGETIPLPSLTENILTKTHT